MVDENQPFPDAQAVVTQCSEFYWRARKEAGSPVADALASVRRATLSVVFVREENIAFFDNNLLC